MVDGDFVADASMMALPADIDPDARKHAAPASSGSRSDIMEEQPSVGCSLDSYLMALGDEVLAEHIIDSLQKV